MEDENYAQATNPTTGEKYEKHPFLTDDELKAKIQRSWDCFLRYKKSSHQERIQKLNKLGDILMGDVDRFAKSLCVEMGKPIQEARKEVEYAAKECYYYAEHLEEFLKPENVKSDAKKSFVVYQPFGPIYHVTPFNFPFWLIFRGTAGALAMGNTVVNKNPITCPQTGINAEEAFKEAGFNNGEFINLIVGQKHSEKIISNNSIRGVSFTGSTEGGKKVAEMAGKYCKKTVMELGGNDAFIVLEDADLDVAVEQGVKGRTFNGGQCCTAAKRFLIHESIYDEFKNRLLEKVKKIKVGDPLEEDTQIGPLAKKSGYEKILDQIKRSKEKGGNLLYGGEKIEKEKLKNGYFLTPAIIEIDEENPLFNEETFGAVFLLMKFKDQQDAIRIANKSEYGLGGAVISKDEKRAVEIAQELEVGAVYINHMVDWKVELPEGGVKNSGFGRDGGRAGALEFVNIKSIYIA